MQKQKTQPTQYNALSSDYKVISTQDPSKVFVQYPNSLKFLGTISGKYILDVGCGNGILTRMIAARDATVVGYDISDAQIELAINEETKRHLGITYLVAGPQTIEKKLESPPHSAKKFDAANATLVLPYARDEQELFAFFSSTHTLLKTGGTFSGVILNPNYARHGINAYNRIFTTMGDNKIRIDFLDNYGTIKISAQCSDFSKPNYEQAAKKAGFSQFKWKPLVINPEGIAAMGTNFWNNYEKDCPYIGFIAKK